MDWIDRLVQEHKGNSDNCSSEKYGLTLNDRVKYATELQDTIPKIRDRIFKVHENYEHLAPINNKLFEIYNPLNYALIQMRDMVKLLLPKYGKHSHNSNNPNEKAFTDSTKMMKDNSRFFDMWLNGNKKHYDGRLEVALKEITSDISEAVTYLENNVKV